MGEGDKAPWDTGPVTEQQMRYLKEMVRRFHEEADWSHLDKFLATETLDKFNTVRKWLGLKFVPMDGMDTSRYT